MNKIPWYDMDDSVVKCYLGDSAFSMITVIINKAKNIIKDQKEKGSTSLERGLLEFELIKNDEFQEDAFRRLLGDIRRNLFENSKYSDYANLNSENYEKLHKYDSELKELFDYENLIHKKIDGRIDYRSGILNASRTTICPYCDRSYITYRNNGKNSKFSGQLDHYYPKSDYPLFAMSLFNFIPCCASCNHTKSNSKLLTLYPYEEGAGDIMVFTSKPKGDYRTDEYEQNLTDLLLGRRKANISLTLEVNTSDAELEKRLNNSKSVFELESLYQSHCNLVSELYLRKRIYDEGSFLDVFESLSTRLGLSLTTESELEAFLYGYQWDGEGFYHDRPLAKLTGDLLKQIKSQDKNS